MNVSKADRDKVVTLLREGKKIEAIHYLRTHFGMGLKSAKKLAEAIAEEYGIVSAAPLSKGKTGKVIGGVFALIGIIFISIALIVVFNQSQFLETAIKVEGTVISNPSQPTFEYEYKGKRFEHYSSTSSNPPSYSIGEKVDLYVNPANPYDVLIDTFTDRYLFITIIGSMGIMFFGMGSLVYFLL